MSLESVPAASKDVWHKVNSTMVTRALVTGEPVPTQCGRKLLSVQHVGERSGGPSLPKCTVCWDLADYLEAARRSMNSLSLALSVEDSGAV